MKLIARKANKNGVVYSIQQEGEQFGVWKLCSNYCPHVPGGVKKVWRYIERGLSFEAAQALYDKKSK